MVYRSLTTLVFSVISLFAMAQNDVTRTTYYTEPGSYGTKRESDPPNYVRDLKALGFSGVQEVDWINIGLDTRNRTEYRQNDIRRTPTFSDDVPVLFKSRAYFGAVW